MIGPEGVAEAIRVELAARYPAELVDLRARLGIVDPDELPAPVTLTAQERDTVPVDDWPAVFVIAQRMTGLRNAELDDTGADVYEARYPIRVFVLFRGVEPAGGGDLYAVTDLGRKRLALATREILLRGLTAVDVDPTTLTESYSDVTLDPDSQRVIAGAYVEAVVAVEERLDPLPASAADVEAIRIIEELID